MSCNICFESGNLINTCSCSIVVHKECIKLWHRNVAYGKVIKKGNLCCPQCKVPGKSEFMELFENDQEVVNIINILNRDSDWTHILCPSCCTLKKYIQESCSFHINDMYSLVCNDCSPGSLKECPGCKISINKGEGCAHMKCICGVHFCWICLEIHNEININQHIYEKHMKSSEYELKYHNYYDLLCLDMITLSCVPNEFQTKDLILVAVQNKGSILQYIDKQDLEICLNAVKNDGCALQYVKDYNFTNEQYQKICLEAITSKASALQYIKRNRLTTEDYIRICKNAVKQRGLSLEYVNLVDLTKKEYGEVCVEAMANNGYSLHYVNENNLLEGKYKQICLEAVRNNGLSITYVNTQELTQEDYNEICLHAIENYWYSLKYIKLIGLSEKQYKNICEIAVAKNEYASKYVNMN